MVIGWGRGVIVGTVAAAAGIGSPDHSLEVALISACGAVFAAVLGPYLSGRFRARRRPEPPPSSHEVRDLNEHLLAECDHKDKLIAGLQQVVADQAAQLAERNEKRRTRGGS